MITCQEQKHQNIKKIFFLNTYYWDKWRLCLVSRAEVRWYETKQTAQFGVRYEERVHRKPGWSIVAA